MSLSLPSYTLIYNAVHIFSTFFRAYFPLFHFHAAFILPSFIRECMCCQFSFLPFIFFPPSCPTPLLLQTLIYSCYSPLTSFSFFFLPLFFLSSYTCFVLSLFSQYYTHSFSPTLSLFLHFPSLVLSFLVPFLPCQSVLSSPLHLWASPGCQAHTCGTWGASAGNGILLNLWALVCLSLLPLFLLLPAFLPA